MKRAIPSLMVSRYATTSSFSPLDIAGLRMWYKADSLALSDNDPVENWNDQSGNGLNINWSGLPNTAPIFKTGIQNGLPVIRFDGSDDYLIAGYTETYGTVFAVCNFNSGGNFPNYNGLLITDDGATAEGNYVAGTGGGSTNLYNGAGYNQYINGAAGGNFSPLSTMKLITIVDTSPNSKTDIVIGNDPAAGSRFWNGDVCEVLIYDTALSATNRQNVENYLISKWGL